MEEVKFIKTGEEFLNISTKLKKECVDYLTQVTKENGSIDLKQERCYVCIPYDCDRYPEYRGHLLFANVDSVSFNADKNSLSIETEDSNDCTVNSLSIDDLYVLALVVYNKLRE